MNKLEKDLVDATLELLKLIEDLLPGVEHIALQNYRRLNEAPIDAARALQNMQNNSETS